jgi:hypothetical protein
MFLLPQDILIIISKYITNSKDLCSLRNSCKEFYELITLFQVKKRIISKFLLTRFDNYTTPDSLCMNRTCSKLSYEYYYYHNHRDSLKTVLVCDIKNKTAMASIKKNINKNDKLAIDYVAINIPYCYDCMNKLTNLEGDKYSMAFARIKNKYGHIWT